MVRSYSDLHTPHGPAVGKVRIDDGFTSPLLPPTMNIGCRICRHPLNEWNSPSGEGRVGWKGTNG
jgi:hypothetical protein